MKAGTTDLVESVLGPNSPNTTFGSYEIHYLNDCGPVIPRRRCHLSHMEQPGPWVHADNGSLVDPAGDGAWSRACALAGVGGDV